MNRRIRAVLFFAIAWGAGWAAIGLAQGLYSWLRYASTRHPAYGPIAWLFRSALVPGILGVLCGAAFALILARAERARTIDRLSPLRVGVWGALGAAAAFVTYEAVRGRLALHPPFAIQLLITTGTLAVLGGLSAAGSLAVARRAQLPSVPESPQLPAA